MKLLFDASRLWPIFEPAVTLSRVGTDRFPRPYPVTDRTVQKSLARCESIKYS